MHRRGDVEQLRKAIRDAATRRFADAGYHGTTVQQIADDVGISKQLLLYHFSSKEALRAAVLRGLLEAWNDLLPRLLDAVATPGARADDVVDDLLGYMDHTSELGRVAMLELMVGKQSIKGEGVADAVRPWIKVAADFVRRRQADGVFLPDADPEAAVVEVGTLLLSTIALLHLQPDNWPEGVDRETWRRRRLKEALRMIRAALIVPAPPGAAEEQVNRPRPPAGT